MLAERTDPVRWVSLSLARSDAQVLWAMLNRFEWVGSWQDLTGRVGHRTFSRSGYTMATTLTAAKGRPLHRPQLDAEPFGNDAHILYVDSASVAVRMLIADPPPASPTRGFFGP